MNTRYIEVEQLYKQAIRRYDTARQHDDEDSQHTAMVRMSAYGQALKALGYLERDLTTLTSAALLGI